MPALEHVVLPAEAERDAEILQLHQVDVAGRIRRDPVQHLEELLAAPRLAVQGHQQRMLRPLALSAPRRRQHGFVQARAQRVARGKHDLVVNTGRARVLFESANLVERVIAGDRRRPWARTHRAAGR